MLYRKKMKNVISFNAKRTITLLYKIQTQSKPNSVVLTLRIREICKMASEVEQSDPLIPHFILLRHTIVFKIDLPLYNYS